MTLAPLTVCESIDFTSFTTAMTNSLKVVTRCSISFAGRPEYDQMTVTTGISILGKMSVGVVAIEETPRTRIRMEATMKVYGLIQSRVVQSTCGISSDESLQGQRLFR